MRLNENALNVPRVVRLEGQQDGAKADKGACHRQKESDVESVQERVCGGGLGIPQHGVKGRPPGDGGCQKQGVGGEDGSRLIEYGIERFVFWLSSLVLHHAFRGRVRARCIIAF